MLISNQSYYEEEGALNLYIAAAPDMREMSEELAKDIFAGYGGVINIWIGESVNVEDKKAPDCLNIVNAAIVLISHSFIETKNSARLVDLPAIEEKMPFLPIAVEKDVEKKFNDVCGTIQFIDKTIMTREDFLNSLFMNLNRIVSESKLREEIRGKLKGRMFISYRRKDRRFVLPLIKRIHDLKGMENLRIWYDSHLTVGADYGDEIFKELHEAQGVVLMVTPSVLETGNYVLDKEIPDALNKNIPVIPLLVEQVNMEQYHELYPSLSDPLTCDEEFTKELAKIWPEKQANETAVEKYNTAIAYLYGFNGEIDADRSVTLLSQITEDSGEEASEAFTKLIDIYEQGIGVPKDPMKAVGWHDKYLNYLIDCYEVNPTREKLEKVRETSYELGVFCYSNGWYPQAIQCLKGALYKMQYEDNGDVSTEDYPMVAKVCYYLGCVYNGMKRYNEATQYLVSAKQQYEKLISISKKDAADLYERLLSDVFEAIGRVFFASGGDRSLETAQGAFWEASFYYQKMSNQSNADKRHLAKIYAQMAEAASREGSNLNDARALYGNAEEKCTSPEPDTFITILGAYKDLLEIYEGIMRVELKRYLEDKKETYLQNFFHYFDKSLKIYSGVTYTTEDRDYADIHQVYLHRLLTALLVEDADNSNLFAKIEQRAKQITEIRNRIL